MSKYTETTARGTVLTVTTRTVGRNFGVEATARVGRKVVATSDTFGLGCAARAVENVVARAERAGY